MLSKMNRAFVMLEAAQALAFATIALVLLLSTMGRLADSVGAASLGAVVRLQAASVAKRLDAVDRNACGALECRAVLAFEPTLKAVGGSVPYSISFRDGTTTVSGGGVNASYAAMQPLAFSVRIADGKSVKRVEVYG